MTFDSVLNQIITNSKQNKGTDFVPIQCEPKPLHEAYEQCETEVNQIATERKESIWLWFSVKSNKKQSKGINLVFNHRETKPNS